jgi:hypothetical protein
MTDPTVPPNPFVGEAGIRIEKAVRGAIETGHVISVGDVLIELRTDPSLSDADFRTFFRALLEARLGFAVERWIVALVTRMYREGK